MIFNHYKVTVAEGLFGGLAHLYEHPMTEVTFEKLGSDRTKARALEIGFSPAVNLPERIPSEDGWLTEWWRLTGETVKPVFRVLLVEGNFFDPVSLDD